MVNATTALIALFLDLIATLANQVSFALQKMAHITTERKKAQDGVTSEDTIKSSLFCSKRGLAGLGLTVIGVLGHFLALPYADLTLIACNSSTAVIFNMWISHKYLGEKFVAKYDVTAVCLVTFGTLVIILLSNKE